MFVQNTAVYSLAQGLTTFDIHSSVIGWQCMQQRQMTASSVPIHSRSRTIMRCFEFIFKFCSVILCHLAGFFSLKVLVHVHLGTANNWLRFAAVSVVPKIRVSAFFTFRVSRRRREMYCGHARLCVSVCLCPCVCLSVRGRMPSLLHGSGCNFGEW